MRRSLTIGVLGALGFATAIGAQNPRLQGGATLPATGADFSGIDQFYVVADLLAKDSDPSDAQWSALFATPGYRLLGQQTQDFRQQLVLALKPSQKTLRDSVIKLPNDRAMILQHLIRAATRRDEVTAIRRALE